MVEDDLRLAIRAALAGADVALRYFSALTGLRREVKVDGSVVTEADRAVEATIRGVLADVRPGDAVLGEEGGQSDGLSGDRRRWIIDPIDGTALFVNGDDGWLVLLALEVDGEIVAGVAVVPAQGRIWWAQRGHGAFEAWITDLDAARRIAVAAVEAEARDAGRQMTDAPADLAASRLSILPVSNDPVSGANVLPKAPHVVEQLLAVTPALPWDVHPPLLVARGDRDLAVQTSGQVWDFAATSLIVTEAGGTYRSSGGSADPAAGPSVFARTPVLAQVAAQLLRS
jgi:histidinol-phosphatase